MNSSSICRQAAFAFLPIVLIKALPKDDSPAPSLSRVRQKDQVPVSPDTHYVPGLNLSQAEVLLDNHAEDTFSLDGTGNASSVKENYESARSYQTKKDELPDWTGMSSRHTFQFSEISVGVHTKMIAGFATAGHSVGELGLLPSVLKQTHLRCPQMRTVLGDAM
jgi:hypothetical protein